MPSCPSTCRRRGSVARRHKAPCMMPDSNDGDRTGKRSLQDRRSTSELIEAALVEADRQEDPPGSYLAIAVLHARGTRDVLDAAALASCRSPDPKRRALSAEILGQLGSPERTFRK